MNDLLTQSRALGDRTRHELFRYISDAKRPVEVAELTKHLGLHHNAIRQHLAKLVDANLVSEASVPSTGRGRPRLCYIIDPSAESKWGVTGPYERLTLLFSEIIKSGDIPVEVGRRSAKQMLCEFETTALVDPETVCGLHLGLAKGAVESLDGLVVDELAEHDPRRGTCRLSCHVETQA